MSASNTVYLNLREMTQVHRKDVYVKDVGSVYCSNPVIQGDENQIHSGGRPALLYRKRTGCDCWSGTAGSFHSG